VAFHPSLTGEELIDENRREWKDNIVNVFCSEKASKETLNIPLIKLWKKRNAWEGTINN